MFLSCGAERLEDRVANVERRQMDKLCDPRRLREILAVKNYRPIPDERCMEVDSGEDSARCNALKIVEAFGL